MSKWSPEEEQALADVRKRLHKELTECPQFPEVIGDRRLMRFLRGKHMHLDEACKLIKDFLEWRKKNNVDHIRQEIVYGGKNTPFKFPKGKLILKLVPQIIISANSVDKKGRPLAMETFQFNPKEVFKSITKEEFLLFLTYSLEFRTLVMEQMSHEYEQKYLKEHPDPSTRENGWGVMLLDFTIRDLKGVGMSHLGSEGRSLVGAALELGYNNYSEYLGKSHMTNVPWIFNAMWTFVKGMLDPSTVAKINFCGSDFMDHLLKDMTHDHIPAALGGGFQLYNEPYTFDTSSEGTLFYPGCEQDAARYLKEREEFEKNDTEEYCYYWNGITPADSPYLLVNGNVSTRTNFPESRRVEEKGVIHDEKEEAKPVIPRQITVKDPEPVLPSERTLEKRNEDSKSSTSKHNNKLHASESKASTSSSSESKQPTTASTTPKAPVAATVTKTDGKAAESKSNKETVDSKEKTGQASVPVSQVQPLQTTKEPFSFKDWILQFLKYNYTENPVLSVIAIFLLIFVLRFHPRVLSSIVPSFILSLVFVYFVSDN